MNVAKSKFSVAVLLCLLLPLFLAVLLWQRMNVISKPLPVRTSEEKPFIPPLYPELSWVSSEKQELRLLLGDSMVYYSSRTHSGSFGVVGKEWEATRQNISKEELYKVDGDFTKYYNDELTKHGWVFSTRTNGFLLQPMATDGPGGGIWGYTKVENGTLYAIILQKKKPISLFTPPVGSPDPCPCDITFRIFVSNPQDLIKVLPKSP